MKRAVILHGTDADPRIKWQPWLKKYLEDQGYEVFFPILPDNGKPNRQTYEKFLRESGWDFSDNIVIGHSSGATTVLNLLLADWFPKVKAVVLVGTFLNEKLTKSLGAWPDEHFDGLFVEEFDPVKLKQGADTFYFVHGDDDPYCDIEDSKILCDAVGGTFITIPHGHHLGGGSGKLKLTELTDRLEQDRIL